MNRKNIHDPTGGIQEKGTDHDVKFPDIYRDETFAGILENPVNSLEYNSFLERFDLMDLEYDLPVLNKILEHEKREDSRAILIKRREWMVKCGGNQANLFEQDGLSMFEIEEGVIERDGGLYKRGGRDDRKTNIDTFNEILFREG